MRNSNTSKSRIRLFRGNVREALPIVIIALVIEVALLALSAWAISDYLSKPQYSTSEIQCTITNYEADGTQYILTTDAGELYSLPIDSVTGDLLNDVIDKSYEMTIKYKVSNRTYLDIISILDSKGNSIVSKESIDTADASNARTSLFVILLVCICYSIFIASSYYILCNASKYPVLAKLLIRKDHRNFN